MNKLAPLVASSAVALSLVALSSPAFGQGVLPADAPSSDKPNGLEDIIVSAQRRDESQQRAAVAIDVLGSKSLVAAGITQPDRLGELSPALTVQGTSVGNIIFIRGVGNFTLTPNSDPATAFNYDGVYLGRPTSTGGSFFDLERVEVLKGPQGTLYGRNATGGAINVIPRRPELGSFSGFGNVSYGNYDALQLETAVNVPLGEEAALRVSGNLVRRDGYLSDGTNDERGEGLRVQLLVEPTPALTVRLAADYSHASGKGSSVSYDSNYFFDFAAGSFQRIPANLPVSEGLGTPAADAYRQTLPAGPAGRTLDILDFTPRQNNRFFGVHADIRYDVGFGTLSVLPAWRRAELDYVSSGGGFGYLQKETDEQFSIEARLEGNRIGAFDYIVGVFYFNELVDLSSSSNLSAFLNFENSRFRTKSFAPFGRATFHLNDQLRLVGGIRYTQDRKSFQSSITNGTIVCTVAIAGVPTCPDTPLYTLVQRPDQITIPFPDLNGPPVPLGMSGAINIRSDRAFDSSQTQSRLTYRAAIEYDIGPASLLYGSVETGFRSGGFSAAVGYETFQPETITAFTVGSKNRFLDNRLQLNIEAFRWNYRDQQVTSVTFDRAGQAGLLVQNIGSSRIQGLEVSASALVGSGTRLSGDIQYLDAQNKSFTYEQANQGLPPLTGCPTALAPGGATYLVDCGGFAAFNSPKWTLNLAAEQSIPIGRHQLVLSANTQFRTERYVGFAYLDSQLVPSTWQSNAQILFEPEGERWLVAAFVRNIENDRVVTYSYTHPFANAVVNGSSAPRTYGVRASVRF